MEYKYPKKELLITNKKDGDMSLYEMVTHKDFDEGKLVIPVGMDENKEPNFIDLSKKSGLFIIGETGSGKSMYLNSIIVSLLLKNSPSDLQFIFIDPRSVEFNIYKDIPHLMKDVISIREDAINTICDLIDVMEERKELFSQNYYKDIDTYNSSKNDKLSHIVIIIDEILDLLESNDIKVIIDKLLLEGNKYGIHIVLSTNAYIKKYFDTSVINDFGFVISFDLASKEQANYVKINKANLLSVYGEVLVRNIENKLINLQTPYITDDIINKFVNNIEKDLD